MELLGKEEKGLLGGWDIVALGKDTRKGFYQARLQLLPLGEGGAGER